MHRLTLLLAVAALVSGGCAAPTSTVHSPALSPASGNAPRNVIFLLGDGMGFAQVKAYRYFADDPATDVIDPLPFDKHLVAAVATDSIALDCPPAESGKCVRDPYGVTDSASSATSYATGRDTVINRVSLDAGDRRMKTILQQASQRGKSTGLVATSQLTHASPAAFAAHVADRYMTNDIADQMFDNQWRGRPMVDVLLGGGLADFRRPDRDLVAEFSAASYETVFDAPQLATAQGPNLLGLFAPAELPAHWDRPASVPSLADMTRAALGLLERDPDGFFLFVEGSQIDWAAHENNVAGVISEMEGFTAAIAVALEYAAARDDTLVILTADHETGGMSLGARDTYRWDPRPLRDLGMTPAAMTAGFLTSDRALSAWLQPLLPFRLTEAENEQLDLAAREELAVFSAICALFDARTVTGWTTHGHTGVDVPLYAFGPGAERLRGTLENEDLGRLLWELFLP